MKPFSITLAIHLLFAAQAVAQNAQPVNEGGRVELYQTQNEQIHTATLFYRQIGSRFFMQQPLLHQNGRWSVSFSGNQLRAPGIEYYIELRLLDGSRQTDPAQYPRYNPMRLEVARQGALSIELTSETLTKEQNRIEFRVNGEVDELARIYIDDIDVTDFVQRDGDLWALDFDRELFSDKPQLQISSADGKLLATRNLVFEEDAQQPAQDRELVVRGNASFSLGGQSDSASSDNRLALSGNLHVESEYKSGDFSSQFSGINVNYQRAADPEFNLSSGFLLDNRYRNHSLQIGDVSVSGTPLVLSGFARRGLLLKTESERHTGELFNVRTAPVSDWESGIAFDDRQTYGLSWDQKLGQDGKSSVQLAVVSGQLQQAESTSVGSSNTQPQSGDSAGVQVTTELGGVSIAAQVATSEYDADTTDAIAASRSDAYELKLSRNIYGLASSLGFHRYGANYATIANPNFSNDRQGFDVSLGSQLQFLGWNAAFSSTRDNILDDPTRPIVTSSNSGINLNVAIENWPSINLGFNLSEQTSRTEPAPDQRVDNTGRDVSLGLSDQFGALSLSWSSSLGRLQDRLDASKDSDTQNHSFSLGYQGERAGVNLNLSQNRNRLQITQISDLVNLSADFPLVSDSIVLNSQFSWQQNSASDDSQDNQIVGGSARVSWTLQDMFTGVTSSWANARFSLSWTYNRTTDAFDAANDSSDQRVLLEFSLGAPVSFEQRWQF